MTRELRAVRYRVRGPVEVPVRIGCQTYPVRATIAGDFPGAIRTLVSAGFTHLELCSPAGYASQGFGGLAAFSGAELRARLADLGATCDSAHVMMRELREDHDRVIDWAHGMGVVHLIVPTLAGPLEPAMDDVRRLADEYNAIAAKSARAGLRQGLHNEGFELSSVDGRRTYDVLLELLDPALVTFQFQVSAIARGFDAADYFTRYPGRFTSMHAQGWSAETRAHAVIGQDSVDWPRLLAAAAASGVADCYLEMSLDLMQPSLAALRRLLSRANTGTKDMKG